MDPLKFVITGIAGMVLMHLAGGRLTVAERRVAALAVVVHLVSAIAQELVYRFVYGGEGDMMMYQAYGHRLSSLMGFSSEMSYEVLRLFFHQDSVLPVRVVGGGSATGSMSALAGLMTHMWSGELYVMGAVIGVFSAMGSLALYLSVRDEVQATSRVPAMASLMLLPSVVFWTSALLKEAVVMGPIGFLTFSLYCIYRRRRVLGALLMGIPSAWIIILIKPYVMVAFVAAGAAFFVLSRRGGAAPASVGRQVGRLLLMGAVSLALLVGFGELYGEYSVESIGEQLAAEQSATLRNAGGSTYSLVSPDTTTLGGQLLNAPLALITVLFRPFLVEAHNALALVNALEATVLLVLAVVAIRRSGLSVALQFLTDRPSLAFCFVFALVLGLGVGLASTNLGALSRYRVPMYGQFALVCVVLATREPRSAGSLTRAPDSTRVS